MKTSTFQIEANNLKFDAIQCIGEKGEANPRRETVICMHGFPDNNRTFEKQMAPLAEEGFEVISVQMRGYQPESMPLDNDFYAKTIAGDLFAWLDALSLDKVHLLSHDWGAVIATAAVILEPDRFKSLTVMGIVPVQRMRLSLLTNPHQILKSWYMFFFQLRGLSELLLKKSNWQILKKLFAYWSRTYQFPTPVLNHMLETLSRGNVLTGGLSYYRASFDLFSAKGRACWKLGAKPVTVPTLVLGSDRDGSMCAKDFSYKNKDRDYPAGIRVKVLKNTGHWLHQEAPGVVNREIIQFLTKACFTTIPCSSNEDQKEIEVFNCQESDFSV